MEKIIITVLIIFTGVAIFFGVRIGVERNDWLTQHCSKIGEVSGSVGIGTTFVNGKVGVGNTYIPGKTGYKCDDGMEYWE